MDKIAKALKKLSANEKVTVQQVLTLLKASKLGSLDVKKLKGRKDIFRVRKGKIRIIYRAVSANDIILLTIERRSDNTYSQLN